MASRVLAQGSDRQRTRRARSKSMTCARAGVGAGRRGSGQEGSGFDPVRHDAMAVAAQLRHALDADHVGAGALDARAHRDQAGRQVDDFRFAGGILDDRRALGEGRRHHEVLGARDRDHVRHDAGAVKPVRRRIHVAMLDRDRRAHGLERRRHPPHGAPRQTRIADQRTGEWRCCKNPRHQTGGGPAVPAVQRRGTRPEDESPSPETGCLQPGTPPADQPPHQPQGRLGEKRCHNQSCSISYGHCRFFI